ncbi:uncharacterized protein LOC128988451 [Macrosteles quadrilineatus]|uniref:uncharacterized protein LOC128988451 n=1 Tax=Macrosteles quadrilineatus TaxID=74068 RepID=UPI0023E2E8B4|nr:uncharacterized protein LOC128988451 [Macrosteles quadrilineatus]
MLHMLQAATLQQSHPPLYPYSPCHIAHQAVGSKQQVKEMSSPKDDHDLLFQGYHERVRAILKHLVFDMQLNPLHPLVISFSHHLEMTTAYDEYLRALEVSPPNPQTLKMVCYRGVDLQYRYSDKVATSLYEEEHSPRDNGWEREQGKSEYEHQNGKSWETDGRDRQ